MEQEKTYIVNRKGDVQVVIRNKRGKSVMLFKKCIKGQVLPVTNIVEVIKGNLTQITKTTYSENIPQVYLPVISWTTISAKDYK